jgi:hypothetical protein
MNTIKKCVKCGKEKSLDLFYNNKKAKDGKCNACKVCMNEVTHRNYQKKRKPKKDWSTDEGFKICRKCLRKKPVGEFNIHHGKTHTKDKLRNECRDCQKAHARAHYISLNKEVERKKRRRWYLENKKLTHGYHLKRKFNISSEEYERLLKAQNGKCAICRADKPGGKYENFTVDHDHETGNIRGLLCSACNTGMGHFKDNPDILRKAIDYLLDR